jgi:GNAT superfamily N-acetyltransferase
MTITCRTMKPQEAEVVAAMLRQLPADLGSDAVPKISGSSLRENADLVHVTVAANEHEILAACAWLITFSSWRAAKGMYVCDLYVDPQNRGRNLGAVLLRAAARQAQDHGARFIKLETSIANPRPGAFYLRNKFHKSADDQLMFLDDDDFNSFVNGADT